MKDKDKTREELLEEITLLRSSLAIFEAGEGARAGTTESSRTEEEFRLQGEIIKNMAEGTHIVKASDGTILYANPSFEKIFGYEPGGLNGKHVSILNDPDDRTRDNLANEVIEALRRDGIWKGEVRNVKKDGTKLHCYVTVSSFNDPRYGNVAITVQTDVTERKRAEEALKLSLGRYQALFDNMLSGAAYHKIVLDEKGRPVDYIFLEVNDAFEKHTCLKREDIIGKSVTEVIPGIKDSKPDLISIYGEVALTGKGSSLDIYFSPLAKWYSISAFCPDKGYFITTFNDITERELGEEALRKANDELELRVKERTVELSREIEERNLTEEALKAERKRLYSILGLFPGFAYLQAPDHSIAFANRRFIEAYGEPNGRPCYEVMWDRKEPCDTCPTFRVFETKKPEVWVSEHTSSDRVHQVYDEPFVETDGSMLVLEISIDITERKRAEEALRDQLRFFQTLIDTIPNPVFYKGTDGRYLGCNRAFEDALGLSKEKIDGKTVYDLAPKKVADKYFEMDSALFNKPGIQIYEFPVSFIDGEEHDIVFNKATFTRADGTLSGLVGVMMDITDLKRAERETDRNYHIQRVLSSILHASLRAISLSEILDYSLNAILSVPFSSILNKGSIFLVEESGDKLRLEVEHGLPESLKTMCATVAFGSCVCGLAASSRKTVFIDHVGVEHTNLYDGIIPHGHYCVPIVFDDMVLGVINSYVPEGHKRVPEEEQFFEMIANTLAGLIVRKRAEEEREALQAQLLHSQKMEAIGRLTSGIAHDFNNLMTAVKTLSSLGGKKAEEGGLLQSYFIEINNASKRATALTRQLSLFSKKGPVVCETVNINSIIETNLSGIISSLIGSSITLTYELSPDLWTIEADTSNIEQIIINLIINAKDAMPGGGSITVRTENNNIKATSCTVCTGQLSGRYVSFEVTDTGVGMEKDTVQKIFEPFFTTKPPGKGTGLGLSVIYGIVNSLNGSIDVASAPGDGSAFRIYLPACAGDEECSEGPHPLHASDVLADNSGGELILFVEDDEMVHEVTGRLLIENGYRVEGAATLAEARRLFEEFRGEVGLLLTDVTLPDGNGIELARELAKIEPGLRVILYSGHIDYGSHLPSPKELGFEFIEKPFEIPELLNAVKKALS